MENQRDKADSDGRGNLRRLSDPRRASRAELEEALVHWDELDASSLAVLEEHSPSAERLEGLRIAERWLFEEARDGRPEPIETSPCPPADELYDFGAGPGARALPEERRVQLEAHLTDCAACSDLIGTLELAPPLPLDWVPDAEGAMPEVEVDPAESAPTRLVALRPVRNPAAWIPLVAAAGLIGMLIVPLFLSSPGSDLAGLPQTPVYRGRTVEPLLFPRGPVLARGSEDLTTPIFELQEVPNASEYRVEVFHHGGGAFEAGTLVQSLRAAETRIEGDPLGPGRYTWQAWARVRGLDTQLGALEFEVRSDEALEAALEMGGQAPSTTELVEAISRLHGEGFVSDAHELARELPESAEKSAYLRPPGR